MPALEKSTVKVSELVELAKAYRRIAAAQNVNDAQRLAGSAIVLWLAVNAKNPVGNSLVSLLTAGNDALLRTLCPHEEAADAKGPFADRWTYTGGDSCATFFTTALKAVRYDLSPGAHVLEVGCAEFDWMGEMARQCPDIHVTGIDWRVSPRGLKADVLTIDFPENYFDACVSISALEHVGLGHYDKDPSSVDGDWLAIGRIWRWLKPGGILHFDVPYNPERYEVVETSHREYDDATIVTRLMSAGRWIERWRGYSTTSDTRVLIDKPTVARGRPGHYVGFVWEKAA